MWTYLSLRDIVYSPRKYFLHSFMNSIQEEWLCRLPFGINSILKEDLTCSFMSSCQEDSTSRAFWPGAQSAQNSEGLAVASPLAHLVSVFTQLHKQGPPSLPSLCSVLAEEVINSFTRGLSSEPSPTQRSPTGGPWTASSPQMCFVWLFLCVFLIVGLAANTLKIMKFLTQMQISTFEKNHKGHITAYEQLASGAEAAPGDRAVFSNPPQSHHCLRSLSLLPAQQAFLPQRYFHFKKLNEILSQTNAAIMVKTRAPSSCVKSLLKFWSEAKTL